MDGVIVLIAHGPNGLDIPCRLFGDMDIAKKRCDEIFGKEGKEVSNGAFVYKVDLESEIDPWPISEKLFTRFYYGCGGPDTFTLVICTFDTKFVGWDLD